MAHATSGQQVRASDDASADGLFKVDRPRGIDRYIDYFEGRPHSDDKTGDDACGEGFLDVLIDTESGAA